MSEPETIFDPKAPPLDRRRVERVELDGGVVYVKEMTAADALFCNEHSLRRGGGPAELQVDMSALAIWQIMRSCYRGREPQAPLIFEVSDMPAVQRLRAEEWNRLRDAINKVNGLAEAEVSALRDFTAAPPDADPATSAPGAFEPSTGFPANSRTSLLST